MKVKLRLSTGFPGCVKCQQGQKLENYFRAIVGGGEGEGFKNKVREGDLKYITILLTQAHLYVI